MKNFHTKRSFISSLSVRKAGFSRGKYAIFFVLGMASIMATYAYVNIDNNIDNAVQYIKSIVLTSDGSESGNNMVRLNT